MLRRIVYISFALIALLLVYAVYYLKDAYKMLPVLTTAPYSAPSFADWVEFNPSSGRFKATFPETPQYAKDSVAIPDTDQKRYYEMYVSEKMNGTIFMINLITYPKEFNTSNQEQLLREGVNEMMATNPSNQLKEIKPTIYQDQPALDFQIVNRDFNVYGKAFMLQKTLYLLTYIAKSMDVDPAEYQHFFNSFQLLNQ